MRGLLASPLGFVIGLSLGALGAGGSILAVPVLVYVAGQDPKAATASSLFLVGTAAAVGVVGHWGAGRVRLGTGVLFGVAGIGGSVAGSILNHRLDPDLLLLGFSGLVLVAAWRMRVGCPSCTKVGEERELAAVGVDGSALAVSVRTRVDPDLLAPVMLVGTGAGFLAGLFGVGGGFVIVPALAINAAAVLATRVATTSIDWAVTIPFTIAAIAGVLTGGQVAQRDPSRSLRWFSGLLVAVGAYTAVQAGLGIL